MSGAGGAENERKRVKSQNLVRVLHLGSLSGCRSPACSVLSRPNHLGPPAIVPTQPLRGSPHSHSASPSTPTSSGLLCLLAGLNHGFRGPVPSQGVLVFRQPLCVPVCRRQGTSLPGRFGAHHISAEAFGRRGLDEVDFKRGGRASSKARAGRAEHQGPSFPLNGLFAALVFSY